jgi:hypothetical protein
MRRTLLLSFFVSAAALTAQTPLFSPPHYATEEGTTISSLPFSGTTFPIRCQQLHTDLHGPATTLKGIAYRRDGTRAPNALFASRSLDLLLRCAGANTATFGATFASNYATPPVAVVTRKSVNSPDFVDQPRIVPAPFLFAIPFDVPFAYAGTLDLLWEVEVFGATGSGTSVPLDGVISGFNLVIPGSYVMVGRGCNVPAASQNEMQLRSSISLQGFPVNAWIFDYAVANAPANAAAVFLFGTVNPNLPVPGLCTNLFVTPVLSVSGTTDGQGAWRPLATILPSPRIAYADAAVGARVEAQVIALDANRPGGLPLAGTNGVSSTLPPWTPTVDIARLHETGTTTGTGTLARGSGTPVMLAR